MKHLITIDQLFDQTWRAYKPHMGYYALLELVKIALSVFITILLGALTALVVYRPAIELGEWISKETPKFPGAMTVLLIIFAIIIFLACMIVLSGWNKAASWLATTAEPKLTISATLKNAIPLIPRYIGLGMLLSLVITTGYLLLILPGIALTILFAFAPAFAQKKSIIGSLAASRDFVVENWLQITGRLAIAFAIIVVIPSMLSSVAQVGLTQNDSILSLIVFIPLVILIYIAQIFFFAPWYRAFLATLAENNHGHRATDPSELPEIQ